NLLLRRRYFVLLLLSGLDGCHGGLIGFDLTGEERQGGDYCGSECQNKKGQEDGDHYPAKGGRIGRADGEGNRAAEALHTGASRGVEPMSAVGAGDWFLGGDLYLLAASGAGMLLAHCIIGGAEFLSTTGATKDHGRGPLR